MSNSRGQAKVVKKNLLDDIDLTTPIHKGYLFKQSLIPPKNFNKRYFALYPKVLIYYDNEATFVKDVLHGTIEVEREIVDLVILAVCSFVYLSS